MKEIKFGIVGTGAIFTLSHANAIKKIPNANITNIFDINLERAQKKMIFFASLNDLMRKVSPTREDS